MFNPSLKELFILKVNNFKLPWWHTLCKHCKLLYKQFITPPPATTASEERDTQ